LEKKKGVCVKRGGGCLGGKMEVFPPPPPPSYFQKWPEIPTLGYVQIMGLKQPL